MVSCFVTLLCSDDLFHVFCAHVLGALLTSIKRMRVPWGRGIAKPAVTVQCFGDKDALREL